MRIGITGSKGFLGSHIYDELKARDNVIVSGCDLPSCDLVQSVPTSFVKNKDVIIHVAGVNRGTDEEIIAGSVVATFHLLTALRKQAQKTKIIFISSIQAGNDSVYGQSKYLTEQMLAAYAEDTGASVNVLRFTNLFGEGGRPFYNSVVATFCHQVVAGEPLKVNNRDHKLYLMYVKDAVGRIITEVFNADAPRYTCTTVSTRDKITVGELADLIVSFRKHPPQKIPAKKLHKNLYITYQSYAGEKT